MKFLFFCIGILAAGSLPAAGAARDLPLPEPRHYAISQIGESLGLATVEALSIVQDRDGFLWVGTSEGLLRYDGISVRRYGTADGLPDEWISDLRLAPDGTLWASSDNGLARFNGRGFSPLTLRGVAIDSEGANQKFAFDSRGDVYIATTTGLIRTQRNDPAKVRVWGTKDGIQSVAAVYADANGRIWFSTSGRIGYIAGNTIAWMPLKFADRVIAILQSGGKIWIRTTAHLGFIAGDGRFVPDDRGIANANAYGLPAVSRSGGLLIPSLDGLYRKRNGVWERIARAQGTSANAVTTVAEDREGAYWLGYEGHGIMRWPGHDQWSAWTESEGLPDNGVDSVLRDRQGRLWAGTLNGLAMWDPEQRRWRTWNRQDGLGGSRVQYMAVAGDGSVYVACYPSGVTRFDPVTLRATSISTPEVAPSLITHNGNILMGGRRALWALATRNGRYAFHAVPVPSNVTGTTNRLSQATDGALWAAGPNGVSRLFEGRWTHYTIANGLRSNDVWDIAAVSRREACVIYAQWLGLTCLHVDGSSVSARSFDARNGLPVEDTGYFVEADRQGHVWTAGAHGLTRIDSDDSMHHFTRDDGLIWDDVNESAFFADSEGSLFFGTSGGLAQYAPHGEEPVRRPLNVVFTSVLIGGKERFGESNASAAHAENSLQVRFSAPTYRRSSAVACRYRLNGLESAFTQTTQREARYGNLPSGAYEIEVACRSPHGPWSAPATYRFSIAAAWWETWWFRLIELLAGGLALYGIILYRTRNLELDRRRLEHAVQARNAELAAAYKELAQKNAELEEASLTDPLTKLHNRRYLDITIHADVAQAIRQHIGLGKVAGNAGPERRRYVANRDIVFYIVDVDHFKDVNDRFGHLAGDTMLIEVARRINSVMRRSDKLVRWGGEEFLVISYPTERTEAQTLASRIMSAFSERPFDLGNSIQLRKTCSIGWAPFPWFVDAPEEINYEKVLWLADRALYAAKSAGRNRAVGLTPLTGAPSIVGDGLLEYQEVHTSGLALSC